jgi:hypothetical protein
MPHRVVIRGYKLAKDIRGRGSGGPQYARTLATIPPMLETDLATGLIGPQLAMLL